MSARAAMNVVHSAGRSTGAVASSKFCAPSLCRISSRSLPSSRAWCSTEYSTPGRRGATTVSSPSGAAASSSHTSLVTLLALATSRNRSLRVRPTPTQNFSSASSKITTSSVCGEPTVWRHTRHGRQAWSTVT